MGTPRSLGFGLLLAIAGFSDVGGSAEGAAGGVCNSSDATAGCGAGPGSEANWRSLTLKDLPHRVIEMEYAIRGEIVTRSFELEKRLREPGHGLPFDELVPCNIGNPQAVGGNPITFHRELLSLLTNPRTLEDAEALSRYRQDVVRRAREYQAGFSKLGAYSHSKGVAFFRREVAKYIERRDGVSAEVPPVDIEDIFLTDGASQAAKTVLELLVSSPEDGILIPIPQYPLYSASITRLGGTELGYELVEDHAKGEGWKLDVSQVEAKILQHLGKGGRVRAIAVINPGNPVSNILSRSQVEEVVRLAERYRFAILADEVYQDNIWDRNKSFVPFRKVVHELGARVEVFSFHSISKGYYGECGLRGGFVHLTNIDPEASDQLYKLFSLTLCANTVGQAMMASILNPPVEGEESFDQFAKERDAVLQSLARKAELVHESLNALEGVQTLPTEGAMYSFPQLDLPRKFLAEAEQLGKAPDMLYCLRLLEQTGVITVPGSGFGQRAGTWHYRMTILPEEALFRRVLGRIARFHREFLGQYLAPGERAVEERSPTPCLGSYGGAVQAAVIDEHLGSVRSNEEGEVLHMLLLLGGSGAGKGTFVRRIAEHGFRRDDFVFHGLDEYIEYLAEYRQSTSNPLVVYKDAADGCYTGAIPIAKAAQEEIFLRRQHLIYEDTGKSLKRLVERVLPPFTKAGYRVTLVLVDNLPNVSMERAPARFMKEGRYSSEEYIASTFQGVHENYETLRKMDEVSESVYCDNSCSSSGFVEPPHGGGCLQCWLDKGPGGLLPASAMEPGPPRKMVRGGV